MNTIGYFVSALLFFAPLLVVNWFEGKGEALTIRVQKEDRIIEDCLEGGLEMRYRYLLQLCQRNMLWFDSCSEERTVVQALSSDPVTGLYKLAMDRWDDFQPPRSLSVQTLVEAKDRLETLDNLSLQYLSGSDDSLMQSTDRYVQVRVLSECKGEYSETFASLSSLLTLGLVQVSGDDTGWLTFNVEQPATEQ